MIGNGGQSKGAQYRVSYRRVICKTGETNLEILCNFPDQPLERQLPDQQLRGLLVTSDFTKSDSSGPEAMGLLDTTSGGGLCAIKESVAVSTVS